MPDSVYQALRREEILPQGIHYRCDRCVNRGAEFVDGFWLCGACRVGYLDLLSEEAWPGFRALQENRK